MAAASATFEVTFLGLGTDTSSLSLDHSTLIFNVAQGGAGGAGGNGGNGLGGGAFNYGTTTLTLTHSTVTLNLADGGTKGTGGANGEGIGGGIYNTPGGTFSFDVFTLILDNDASTRGDNIGS